MKSVSKNIFFFFRRDDLVQPGEPRANERQRGTVIGSLKGTTDTAPRVVPRD